EKACRVLGQPVCDHCLGRQFGQLLSGFTNAERGKALRMMVAMSIDREEKLSEKDRSIDLTNFYSPQFRKLKDAGENIETKCLVCGDIFKRLYPLVGKAVTASKKMEWRTFVVGTRLSNELLGAEEKLWERAGINYCEPIKAELNRELGKTIEKLCKNKEFDPKTHDIAFLFDMDSTKVSVKIFPIFIYGEYQKLVRGIPQTKWPDKRYKTSVEQIIAKPFMTAMKGSGHKLHGCGREDIDARCLAWRPFVIEILEPIIRKIDIKKIVRKISKQVKVRNMRLSNIQEVRVIKEARLEKSYKAIVVSDETFTPENVRRILSLGGQIIRQRTPNRVAHRRADLTRKRQVVSIKAKKTGKNQFEIIVRGEAGLYIKELISGDEGRTKPSISEIIGVKCRCKELDVVGIHKKK
ncbi:MAG: tRNA pseudouridine(54/55) synthase Pus10, partial [Candidatus Aenigmatarchaeota archaeon]